MPKITEGSATIPAERSAGKNSPASKSPLKGVHMGSGKSSVRSSPPSPFLMAERRRVKRERLRALKAHSAAAAGCMEEDDEEELQIVSATAAPEPGFREAGPPEGDR